MFAKIDQKVIGSEMRLDWTFTPRLTLQGYLQPFIAVGQYDAFKELAAPTTFEYNMYGTGAGRAGARAGRRSGTMRRAASTRSIRTGRGARPRRSRSGIPDFNYKSLRGTVVLRWEYRPGSLLYFVWTQNRADYADPGELRLWRDMGDLFCAPGDNIFLLKVSYRWNI